MHVPPGDVGSLICKIAIGPSCRAVRCIVARLRRLRWQALISAMSFDEAKYRDRLDGLKKTNFMLKPQGFVRIPWDVLIMTILLYLLISMPYRIGFDAPAEGNVYYFEKVINYMFWVDIALNFRTGYMEGGITVMNWKKIARHYITGWFVIDVVASFPYDEILEGDQINFKTSKFIKSSKVTKVLKLFKLLRLSKIAKSSVYLEILEDWFSLNRSFLEASKLFFFYFILAHFVACLWAFVGRLSLDDRDDGNLLAPPPWWEVYSRRDGLAIGGNSSWYAWSDGEQYLTALYFAVSSIGTMGFGDIVPISHAERAYVMVLVIVGSGFYALVIANVSTLVGNRDSNGRIFNEKMDALQFYLTNKKIPTDLAFKIRKHFKQLLLSRRAMDEADILLNLPSPIKVELSAFLIDGRLTRLPIFADLTSESLLKVFALMKSVEFREGDIITRQGDTALTAFILLYGETVLMRENGEVLHVMKVGDMFGELSVLRVELVRGCTVICRTVVECYILDSSDLFAAFHDDEEEMDKMLVGAIQNALETYRASRKLAVLEDKLHQVYLRRQQRQAQITELDGHGIGLFTMSKRARKFLFPVMWRSFRAWRMHFKNVRLSTRLIQRFARKFIEGKRVPPLSASKKGTACVPSLPRESSASSAVGYLAHTADPHLFRSFRSPR
jgi:CRP-like cAMP-binding protein